MDLPVFPDNPETSHPREPRENLDREALMGDRDSLERTACRDKTETGVCLDLPV